MRSIFGRRGRRLRRTASAVSLALVAGVVVVLALNNDGDPITEVSFNDGSVWVTNERESLIGRLNPQIQELDLGMHSPGVSFDVQQRATSVFTDAVVGADTSIVPIDVARATGGSPTALPSGTEVAYNAQVFALRDPNTGRAWVQHEGALTTVTAKSKDQTADNIIGTAVGTDGTAYLVGRDGTVITARFTAAGGLEKKEAGKLPEAPGESIEVTVVGTTPVVLDTARSRLLTIEGDPIDLNEADGAQVHLQQPSAEADDVVVGTPSDVIRVPLSGGDRWDSLRTDLKLPGAINGEPAPPVIVGGCVYAAWADPTPGAGNYLRDCEGTGQDDAQALDGEIQNGATLKFRVNRQVVVLNDTMSGDAWLVQQPGHKKVTNWDSINPEKQNKPTQQQVTDKVERKENRPPVAVNDELSVRQNKSSILPIVAMNDHDPDGDIITIKNVRALADTTVEAKIISGGTQLQVTVRNTEPGLVKFKYWIDDGNGSEASAEVRLTVLAPGAKNNKPELMKDRIPELTVAKGKSSSMYLLADFYDRDGDDLVLTDAKSAGGQVESRPDGTIQFTDNGDGNTRKQIQYTIEDGHGGTYEGKFTVTVVEPARAVPELIPDLKSGVANTRVLVQPLLNDRNPGGGDLFLEKVKVRGDATGTKLISDARAGSFIFSAEKARPYYIDYSASGESGERASSFVRFDVESPPKNNTAPIAVGDKAVLAPGSTTEADLLLNDIDKDNDVMVVTKVGPSSIPGVKVSVTDKRVAVISSSADLAGQSAVVPYSVSDGHNSTDGTLTITQRSGAQGNSSPVANEDQITAREGSVATLPALTNDSDPDGGKLEISYVKPIADSSGTELDIWVADNALRFKAPKLPTGKPRMYKAIYGIKDDDGRKSDAEVMVFVIPDSAENNHPPAPTPIIERAVAGQPKTIAVDLAGADPDGDALTFTRVISAPKRGRILETGADWIKYEAYENRTGTDFFQLEVRDKFGDMGVAAVRVGIVPRLMVDQPPVALDDSIAVRPDRRISVYVLGNDVDPDDDKLLIGDDLEAPKSLNASQRNGFISLDVPRLENDRPVTSTVGYQLFDEARQSDNALVRVEARKDAPLYAPVAQDDVVELADVAGRSAGSTVEVEPLKNDLDVDGSPDQLRITGCRADTATGCRRVGDKLKITLTEQDQVIVYDLADADKESPDSSGVVFVRGTNNIAPTVNAAVVPVSAQSGVPLPIDLGKVAITRPGREPRLVLGEPLEAINGQVKLAPDVENQVIFTSARDYKGPASVSLSVTDSRGSDDKEALESIVTVPIDVKPVGNVAPVVRGADITVAEESDVELDLAGLVRDVNPAFGRDEMLYSIVSADDIVSAKLNGSTLTVSATGSEAATGTIVFAVDDREGEIVQAVINVKVVSINRPLARVPTIELKTERGETTAVDIADYAQNPYAADSKPLTVHKQYAVEGADASAIDDFKVDGTRISFVPRGTGVMTLRFKVSDASEDAARDVVGRIRVAVAAPPEQPTRPEVSSVEARSVVLQWREPDNNGSPITRYKIKGTNGFESTCEATTCNLTNLDPGNKYSFQVAAENESGPGPWSASSESVIPNKVPGIMAPPRISPDPKGRDGRLSLSWDIPENEGDEITDYVIKWNGGTKTVKARTTETITGLENGTAYMFSIHAVNTAGRGAESPTSDPEIPFGKPLAAEKPSVTPSLAGASPTIMVDWSEPDPNGDQITKYVVRCDRCSPTSYVVEGQSKTFNVDNDIRNGVTYTFTVAAVNRAGEGPSGPSDSAMPYRPAGQVRNLAYTGSPDDRTARIRFSTPDLGGLGLKHYVLQGDGLVGPKRLNAAAPNGVDLTFSDNSNHSISIYAVTEKGRTGEISGESADLGNIETWGKPGTPTGSGRPDGYYNVDISSSAGVANGREVTGVEYLDGTTWTQVKDWEDVNLEVPFGGDQKCASFRTVSAASGDRKYSDATPLCGRSTMRKVVHTRGNEWRGAGGVKCGILEDVTCTLRSVQVEGEGFEKSKEVAWSFSSVGDTAGTCREKITPDADGDFKEKTDGECWFADDEWGVVATVGGVTSLPKHPWD